MNSFDKIMMDPMFIAYMNERNNENEKYWVTLIESNPELKNEFEKAVKLYSVFLNNKSTSTDEEKNLATIKLLNRIGNFDNLQIGKTNSDQFKKIIRYAAVAVLFITLFIPASLYVVQRFKPIEIVYNEIEVPSGEKSAVKLSDGTIVWLNSESKLKYPVNFNTKCRNVYLEGEGYFDVAKQDGKNFIVNTQNIKVVALGTIFNVKSYPEDDNIEATLVEGSIKFQQNSEGEDLPDIILKPDQKLTYQKEIGKASVSEVLEVKDTTFQTEKINTKASFSIEKVNASNIVSWKDHLLVFENETFEEIAKKMSRWYKMDVVIKGDELKDLRFTGKFIHNETFIQVLEAIDLTTSINYDINANSVIIQRGKSAHLQDNKL